MENFTPEQKQPVVKSLAIAGLIGVLIFIAWLAVQIVQVLPTAVSSLASLANSVYTYSPDEVRDLSVASSQTLANVNEPITLTWISPNVPGTFTFQYECEDGVAMSLSTQNKNFPNVACGTPYDLGDAESASIAIAANSQRFTDISYKISFYRTNDTKETAAHADRITVVNTAISTTTVAVTEPNITTPEPVVPVTKPEPEPEPEPAPEPKPITPVATTTPKAPKPEPKPEIKATSTTSTPKPATPVATYVYAIPTSNPNGIVDLAVTLIGIGTISNTNQFLNSNLVLRNQPGAIQFSVHNIGQKTSERWTFEATLPGGLRYTSPTQVALKPNERAVITVEFPGVAERGTVTYAVKVETAGEARTQNNAAEGSTLVR